ncbi:MAG: hypothetical protein LBJ45_00125 [Holosporaceae bacterium]|jgi:hypothetical protein|nr:hypothetical protein [Holosporaceae bacterium]
MTNKKNKAAGSLGALICASTDVRGSFGNFCRLALLATPCLALVGLSELESMTNSGYKNNSGYRDTYGYKDDFDYKVNSGYKTNSTYKNNNYAGTGTNYAKNKRSRKKDMGYRGADDFNYSGTNKQHRSGKSSSSAAAGYYGKDPGYGNDYGYDYYPGNEDRLTARRFNGQGLQRGYVGNNRQPSEIMNNRYRSTKNASTESNSMFLDYNELFGKDNQKLKR